ncbi:hypothetical protein ACIGXM_14200 [Kitasatospora sp. NPDC052896]|uniref:hypothetical protein n=1 Tax=Kitasatospora sp. NPDC052896 TaxID=3364061 RepID=UPI0037C75249
MSVRPEHAPGPGVTWHTRVVTAERVVPDDTPEPEVAAKPNRAARRALKRAGRKNR